MMQDREVMKSWLKPKEEPQAPGEPCSHHTAWLVQLCQLLYLSSMSWANSNHGQVARLAWARCDRQHLLHAFPIPT